MNWIRKEKRLAIYLRDGLACVWCSQDVENVRLTLDHLQPYKHGGSNDPSNLVTACHACNSLRQDRKVTVFAKASANFRNIRAEEILRHITKTSKKPIDVPAAKRLIAARGGFTKALKVTK